MHLFTAFDQMIDFMDSQELDDSQAQALRAVKAWRAGGYRKDVPPPPSSHRDQQFFE